MSLHYEVVFTCFLRDDTPIETLDVLRWHLGLLDDWPPGLDQGGQVDRLLCPDPASSLPGGDVAALQQQLLKSAPGLGTLAWGLFARTLWPDDRMDDMAVVMELIAPHVAEAGYGGYFRPEDSAEATAFSFAEPAVTPGS
jgi:hypothetical protein